MDDNNKSDTIDGITKDNNETGSGETSNARVFFSRSQSNSSEKKFTILSISLGFHNQQSLVFGFQQLKNFWFYLGQVFNPMDASRELLGTVLDVLKITSLLVLSQEMTQPFWIAERARFSMNQRLWRKRSLN